MLVIVIFLIMNAVSCFSASSSEQRLDYLEIRLDTALNRTEANILELKETIQRMNNSNFQICKEEQVEILNETKETKESNYLTYEDERKTMMEEMKRVHAHVEMNSKALMDEYEKTLTVLLKQHGNINQKIQTNAVKIGNLEQKLSLHHKNKELKNVNAVFAKLEDKLTNLDDNINNIKKHVDARDRMFDSFDIRLSKLDKKDYEFNEDIERIFRSAASIDLNLVEMDRRYQEFVRDLNQFKSDIHNKIEKLTNLLSLAPGVEHVETKTCPQNWIQHGSTCYLYDKESGADWEAAQRVCRTFGAKLAEPDTREEMNFLRRFVHGWIGASDLGNEGVFIWESSKNAVEYFPWWPGMPDDFGGHQDCASIWGTMINDEDCTKRYRYVCQKELK